MDVLKRKKGKKKQSYKANKKHVLENAQALYHELNIIVDAFENRIFESKYRPEIDVELMQKIIQKTFKNEIRRLLYSLYRSKNLKNNSIKV